MIPSVEEGKNAMLKVYTAEIKRDHPSWTFVRCWQAAQAAHPDLAESFDEQPSAQPAYQAPPPGQVAADQVKLDELLRKLNMPKKVQADKKDNSGELMLVMASNGEIVGLTLE